MYFTAGSPKPCSVGLDLVVAIVPFTISTGSVVLRMEIYRSSSRIIVNGKIKYTNFGHEKYTTLRH